MDLNQTVTTVAVLATAVALVGLTVSRRATPPWWVPAGVSAAFAAWSAYAVADGGLFGFWPLHTASPWGVQVFVDLLLMALVAWSLLLPRLRARAVNPWPWLVLVATTGSIGMLAAVARLLHAEQSSRAPERAAGGPLGSRA
jgi:hypothetical protein